MTTHWLAPREAGRSQASVPGDYRYLEDVVRIGFPVRDARTFLNRQLGNPVSYRLVEAQRGERVGHVREIEVVPASGGDVVRVRAFRTMPDGSPASYFAPDELITISALIETDSGAAPPSLQPRDRILLHIPVRSYLRFLPGIYQGGAPTSRRDVARVSERQARQRGAREESRTTAVAAPQTDQFRRFLFLFQHLMTTVTDRIDQIPALTDPMTADARFLPWIASWVGFELDESLPVHQQRELVKRSIRLYRTRGTRRGVEEMIEVLTGTKVQIVERKKPQISMMGAMTLAGGRNLEERYLRGEPPGCFLLPPGRSVTTFFALRLEDRASFKKAHGERAPAVLRRIAQIVTNEKPAHVTFTIEFEERVR